MPRAQWRRQRLRRPRTVLRPTVPVDRLLRASAEIRRQGGGASSALSGTGSSAVVVVPAAGEDGGEGDCGSGDGDSGSGDDGALASTTALTAAAGTPTGSGEYEGRTLAQTAWDSPSTPPAKSRQSRQSSTNYHYYCNYDCCELTSACFTSAPRLAARGGSAGGG